MPPAVDANALRIARHTERLDEVVAFYRDGLGLPEVGRFAGHDGYDGVFLAVPGTAAHLELTSGGAPGAPAPHPESLLVLYLGDAGELERTLARAGAEPVTAANPYWAEHGVTVEDPDGFRVVLVPERWTTADDAAAVRIVAHTGPRVPIRWLFELAEDSRAALDAYVDGGLVLVAIAGDEVVGHVQVTDTAAPGELELKSLAVSPACRRRGVGSALVSAAAALARDEGAATLILATAAADARLLGFYQRLGFRLRAVERDAFTEAAGYPPGLMVDGVELRDRVWLDLEL
jgi:ribosomal protein S18 acetylase RimI-like enzyme